MQSALSHASFADDRAAKQTVGAGGAGVVGQGCEARVARCADPAVPAMDSVRCTVAEWCLGSQGSSVDVAIRHVFHLHLCQVLFLARQALLRSHRLLPKRPWIDAQCVDAQPEMQSFL